MKRLFWLVVGFVLGASVARRRHADGRGSMLDRVRRRVDHALHEGRAEAKRRELELRSVFASTRNGAQNPDK